MKTTLQNIRRGFTLVELTVAMMVGIMTGSIIMALFNQQLAFLRIYRAQGFLVDEAPMVNQYVSRIVGKANRFRLHESVADALSGSNPRLTESPVVLLNFRQPDGSMRASILSFEQDADGNGSLLYYVIPELEVLETPEWSITRQAEDVTFTMEQGILRTTLTGPAGEKITYSGSMQ